MANNENDENKEFIKPELEEGNQEKTKGNVSQDSGMVLASRSLPDRIYILPSESKPVFPGIRFPLVIAPGPAADLIREAAEQGSQRIIGFVLTRNEEGDEEDNTAENKVAERRLNDRQLYRYGCACRILRVQETEQGGVQVMMQGEKRFKVLKVIERQQRLIAQVAYLEDIHSDSDEVQALSMSIVNTMRELIQHNPVFSEEIKMFLSRTDWEEPGQLADFACSMTSSSREELQDVLECIDVKERLEKVLFLLRKELDLNQLKEKITSQIEEKISQQQREYFLREQLKAIKQELGMEKDEKTEEVERYQKRLNELDMNEESAGKAKEELEKLKLLSPQSPEFSVTRNYLDWLTTLPWGYYSKDRLNVQKSRKVLNRDHYGLEDVKNRILEFIGVAKLRGSVSGSILCLVGPPGVGKTSLGRAVAESLGREFFRFSLGGIRDEAEIKGHRRTYIGAMPGKVMQAIKGVGTANPVIMLDEIDKVGASFQGDPASALLEVLDPEQNSAFRDHYLDVPFDLSKVLFIATANVPDTIPGPLLNRMEMIRLSGYILEEKIAIAKRHLVPRQLENNALTRDDIRFTDGALKGIATGYAREAGVRDFEKSLSTCMRKVAAGKAEGKINEKVAVKKDNLEDYLGKPQFMEDTIMKKGRPGVAMGMAWTPHGGTTLYVEAVPYPGEGQIRLTGQLGNVMSESSHIAYSLVTSDYSQFGIKQDFFKDKTVHLHVPAGATPKDGPSAGITMATALVSLGLNTSPPPKVAMTGELTLTGRVLEVGGIKEKIIAAKRAGVKHVILPGRNEKDYAEIPEHIRKGIKSHFVDDYYQVYKLLFKNGLS